MKSISEAIDDQHAEFEELIRILFDDVKWHINRSDNSQESYRACIHAIFAWIDGTIASLMGRLTEFKLIKDASSVSDDELDHLLDLHAIPKSKSQKRKRFKLDESIKATLSAFAKACHVEFDLSTHSVEWLKFKETIKIRNRVTHPKRPADLEITEEQIIQVANSGAWLQSRIAEIAEARLNRRPRTQAHDNS